METAQLSPELKPLPLAYSSPIQVVEFLYTIPIS